MLLKLDDERQHCNFHCTHHRCDKNYIKTCSDKRTSKLSSVFLADSRNGLLVQCTQLFRRSVGKIMSGMPRTDVGKDEEEGSEYEVENANLVESDVEETENGRGISKTCQCSATICTVERSLSRS